MSTKVDANGRRFVQSETEVTGTPDEVWQAIATGPGVSSWFVPCTMDGHVGGQVTASFGPGMESTSTITAWNPPHSFVAEGSEMSPGSPKMATEWTVEAKAGGTCVVRVVHSWFAETDEWDGQFEGTEHGWPAFFRDLALYLGHFKGQPSKTMQLMAFSSDGPSTAWAKLLGELGLAGRGIGEKVEASRVTGEIRYMSDDESLVLAGNGIFHFMVFPMGESACVSVRSFVFGEGAAEVLSRDEPIWADWLSETFPPAANPYEENTSIGPITVGETG